MRVALLTIGLLFGLGLSGSLWSDSAAVFMYHRFGETQYPATSVRMDEFREQLMLLRDEGFEVVPLKNLLAALRGQGKLPPKAVVLTIDDAYASIYSEAWPALREAGMPFTVLVATDPVDAGLPDYLTWAQLREMAESGVTFANHGASHETLIAALAGEDSEAHAQRVRGDLLRGQSRLQAQLGSTGAVLEGVVAYPFGEYDAQVAGVIEALGWVAFGQQSGPVGPLSDRLALPRFPINETYSDLDGFRTKAGSLPLPVERIEPWDPVSGSMPQLELWVGPSGALLDQLSCFVSGQGQIEPLWLDDGRHFQVRPNSALPTGRSRVNCTAPDVTGRYYWFSHQWIVR